MEATTMMTEMTWVTMAPPSLSEIQPPTGRISAPTKGPIQAQVRALGDRKSTRLNSSHVSISYAVFCLKKKKRNEKTRFTQKLTENAEREKSGRLGKRTVEGGVAAQHVATDVLARVHAALPSISRVTLH